jgi:RNA polymerase sigma-70 factor (ECF subfamily)
MAGVAEGDPEAFRLLSERWRPRLVNYFRSLGADLHGAEDCAQETLLRVHGYRRSYRPDTRYEAFLFTLARHAFLDARRRAIRRPAKVGLPEELLAEPLGREHAGPPDGSLLDLSAAVAALPERLRGVVELGAVRGLPYEQVAALLGIPVGTVKSRMHLAVRRLREVLSDGDEARG